MKLKKITFVLIVAIFAVSTAFAFQFSPFVEQTFSPTGADSTKSYTIVNDSDESIAIEMSTLIRDQDSKGNELNKSAANYFSIVPSKVIVKPQSTQIIRVQYKGPRTVTSELSFRLRAEQIDYSLGRQEQNQSMFNFLYVYTASVYVAPSKIVESVVVKQVTPGVNEDGEQVLNVTLANTGNVHQILTEAELTLLDNSGNRVILGGDKLPGIDGSNVLARKIITKTIPWPKELPYPETGSASYKAQITYSK